MKRAKAEALLSAYFDDCHYIMFADWDLSKPERRDLAIKWFVDICVVAGIVKDDEL